MPRGDRSYLMAWQIVAGVLLPVVRADAYVAMRQERAQLVSAENADG